MPTQTEKTAIYYEIGFEGRLGILLWKNDIKTIKALTEKTIQDLYQIPMIHPSDITLINSELGKRGLSLKSKELLQNYTPEMVTEAVRASLVSVEDLCLTARSANGLMRAGVRNVGDILFMGKNLKQIYSLGNVSVNEIMQKVRLLSFKTPEIYEHSTVFQYLADHPEKFKEIADNLNLQASKTSEHSEQILAMDIEELDLSVRTYSALKKAGINTCADLLSLTIYDLQNSVRNLGFRSINEIAEKLDKHGMGLPAVRLNISTKNDEQRKVPLDDRIRSVAQFAGNKTVRTVVLESDEIRKKALDTCYKIPGYENLDKEDKNKLYDLVKKAVTSELGLTTNHSPERPGGR